MRYRPAVSHGLLAEVEQRLADQRAYWSPDARRAGA